MGEGFESPYMLVTAPVREAKRLKTTEDKTGLDRLSLRRSVILAVTHVDHSARIQTVTEERNGRFHRLLKSFERLTDCPLLLNTSFNVKDQPIVAGIEDAWECFTKTGIDVLVLERFLVMKKDVPRPT